MPHKEHEESTKFDEGGVKTPSSPCHNGIIEEEGLVIKGPKAATLTPIPKSQQHEVNIAHFVVNTENVLTCDESRDETRGVEQEGEEKGLVGNPSPMKHDDNKPAGLFRTTVNKRQIYGVHEYGKSYRDALCEHHQDIVEAKVEKTSFVKSKEKKKADFNSEILSHKIGKMEDVSITPHPAWEADMWGTIQDISLQGYVVPVDLLYDRKEVFGIITPCTWLKEKLMENYFEIIMYANMVMKDSTLQGQGATSLINGEDTHGSINECLVAQVGLKVEDFKGFIVKLADGHSMQCTKMCSQLQVALEPYEVCADFYVMADLGIMLGVQWWHSLGELTLNYQRMEISFMDKGKKITLQGMLPETLQISYLVEDIISWESHFCSLSKITADWKSLISAEYVKNKFANVVFEGEISKERYKVMDGLILYKNRVYLVPESRVKNMILRVVHDTPWADHPGHFMRHDKGEGNSDFSLYGLLTHGSMREPKEVRAKGNNYDKLAAVHMATKEENDGSIFQFYDPMMRYGFCLDYLVFISSESHNVWGYLEIQNLEKLSLKSHMEFEFHLKNDEIKIHGNAKEAESLRFKAKITADFNCRPAVPKFSAYVNQISVLTLFMELLFFVKFQSGSCYTMIIGLNLQKSDLGLPLAAMNNSVFSFFECIPSWNNEKGRFQLNGGIKSDYDVLFSDLYILIFERKMHEYNCFWDSTIEVKESLMWLRCFIKDAISYFIRGCGTSK
ncbi:hypothetical protein KI387_006241 [Taxus chinensis]|uniref:Uncharacterized protein n=1 Tax=Taxus chinensis TaxID=29808 RepID=A0AA38GPW6_TAXCH|nr:hypothetical protein KI387_006241 [Taxus chinensis]